MILRQQVVYFSPPRQFLIRKGTGVQGGKIPGRPPSTEVQPRRGVVQKSSRPMLQEAAGQEVASSDGATFAPPFFLPPETTHSTIQVHAYARN